MMVWTGTIKDGYSYVKIRGETSTQKTALRQIIPPHGCKAKVWLQGDELWVSYENDSKNDSSESDDKPAAKKRGRPRKYQSMDLDGLKTYCAENGIEVGGDDTKPDLIRKIESQ